MSYRACSYMVSSLCLARGRKFNIYASLTDSDLLAREDTNHQLSSRKRITIRLFRSHAKPVIYKLLPSPFHPSLRNHRSEYCQHSVFISLLGRQSPPPDKLYERTSSLSLCASTGLFGRGYEQSAYRHPDYLFPALLVSEAQHVCSFQQPRYQRRLASWANLGRIPETK